MTSSVLTVAGKKYTTNRVVAGDVFPEINRVLVGTGTTAASESDEELESQVYSETFASGSSSVVTNETVPGSIDVQVELTGGIEVPPDTEITEFGLKTTTGDLIYREVRAGTNIPGGERFTFNISLRVQND